MNSKKFLAHLSSVVQAKGSRSMLLGVRQEGIQLNFGLNTTGQVEFFINLVWPDSKVEFDNRSFGDGFILLFNQNRQGGPLQLAILGKGGGSDPLLLFDEGDPDCPPLQGEILILATSPNGQEHAVLSVVFDGQGHGSYLSANTVEAGLHFKILFNLYRQEALYAEGYGEEGDDSCEPYGTNIFPL